MLRLSDQSWSSPLGGWSLVEQSLSHEVSTARSWSLVVLSIAAIVAVLATALEVQFESISFSTNTAATSVTNRASVSSEPAIDSAVAATSETVQASAAPVATAEVASVRVEQAVSAPTRGSTVVEAPSSTPAIAAEESAVGGGLSAQSLTTAVQSEELTMTATGAAALVDPVNRIRAYLGLEAASPLPVSFGYEVQSGDTASSIAAQFGLQEATVLFNNFDIYDPNHLVVGQRLQLPSVDGLIYVVQPGDSLHALMGNYLGDLEATLAYPPNGLSSADQIFVGQRLLLVQASASLPGGAVAASSNSGGGQTSPSAAAWSVPTFLWPLGFDGISDLFGVPRANAVGYHTGVDFTAPVGTIVGSSAGGQVTVATWGPAYGNWVEIDHGGGYRTRYAHLNEIWVREGEWVDSNQFIGTVGNTGYSSGAHLHFEIIENRVAVNPLGWLN